MITEQIAFDASYDAAFIKGLNEGGVPIKFSSWNYYQFSTQGASNVQLLVPERSRSVKALFAVQRRQPDIISTDSHALLYDSSTATNNTLQSFQWRIGGKYFPASPVQCSLVLGGNVSNGGAEAYVELQKSLNQIGDYRLQPSVNVNRWAMPTATAAITLPGGTATAWPELDYATSVQGYTNGCPTYHQVTIASGGTAGCPFSGNAGSGCFAMSTDLETSNGVEISGLNAEEQSDIGLLVNWSAAQTNGFSIEVLTYIDKLMILRANNVVELVQ